MPPNRARLARTVRSTDLTAHGWAVGVKTTVPAQALGATRRKQVASNIVPNVANKLIPFAEMAANGLRDYGKAIGVQQNTEEKLRAEIAALHTARIAPIHASGTKTTASAAQNESDLLAKQFIASTRKVLSIHLGNSWNSQWQTTGFPNGSTAVPESPAVRFDLLQMLVQFLANNPGFENKDLKVTAAWGQEIQAALSARRSACANAIRATTQSKQALDQAMLALRKRLRGLIEELRQLLSDSDPLYYAFGLNAPADPSTPCIPDGLHFKLSGTTAYLDWADSRRADRYRVWKQTLGLDDGFQCVATVWESDYTLEDLPAGKISRVQVSAVNAAGESQPSPSVEIQL